MNSKDALIKIDHYTVIKKIWEGTDSSTYLVRNDQDGLIYVIKVFEQGVSPWIIKAYIYLAKLDHINILKFLHLDEGTLTF